MKARMYLLFATVFLMSCLASCGGIGSVASPMQSAADQGSLTLTKPISPATHFVDDAMAVGTTLGYQVSAVNRKDNIISFTKQSSLGVGVLIGRMVVTYAQLSLRNDCCTIDINVRMNGNFNEVNQAAVMTAIAAFKEGLARQFAI